MKSLLELIGVLVLVALLWSVLKGNPRDATDEPGKGRRSGMTLRTDYGTGCQYLCGPLGGCTPRMGIDGRQICEPKR